MGLREAWSLLLNVDNDYKDYGLGFLEIKIVAETLSLKFIYYAFDKIQPYSAVILAVMSVIFVEEFSELYQRHFASKSNIN